ncbi:hypothetical protein JNW88_00325 [Micromonospora sp. ATA32]|nr:hypothetical protein [Micromonospora sp. ATA32]
MKLPWENSDYRRAAVAQHTCCYHVAAAKAVLADRERELLDLKGPCSTTGCPLHYAHSGPCHPVAQP